MRFETVVHELLLRFPEYREEVHEPMGDEEPLAYVAFGGTVMPRLEEALRKGDLTRVRRFAEFFEEIAESALTDLALENLVVVEIGEWLVNTDQKLLIAPLLGVETRRMCSYVPDLATQRRSYETPPAKSSLLRRLGKRLGFLRLKE